MQEEKKKKLQKTDVSFKSLTACKTHQFFMIIAAFHTIYQILNKA